jgi:glycerophosphoryl diester phosphodiesterase
MKLLGFILGLVLLFSCSNKKHTTQSSVEAEIKKDTLRFDVQGHRGARGLAPENTLPAFKKALEIGVSTLELDLAVTKDGKLLVSHEPWFNRHICLDSLGNIIPEEDSIRYIIYEHTYAETQKYDCGSLGNPQFPHQEKQKLTKPLLKEVIEMTEAYCQANDVRVSYNFEIKSLPLGDHLYHPEPKNFCDLLIEEIKDLIPNDRIVIQSFDYRPLEYLHAHYPEYKLAALAYKGQAESNLSRLSFVPAIYSPEFNLLTVEDIRLLKEKNITIIPWTVNQIAEMKKLVDMGVDGVITDYPDSAMLFLNQIMH